MKESTLNDALAAMLVCAALIGVGTQDYRDQAKLEAHKKETIAAARKAAKERAHELREDDLIKQANSMMSPLAQVPSR